MEWNWPSFYQASPNHRGRVRLFIYRGAKTWEALDQHVVHERLQPGDERSIKIILLLNCLRRSFCKRVTPAQNSQSVLSDSLQRMFITSSPNFGQSMASRHVAYVSRGFTLQISFGESFQWRGVSKVSPVLCPIYFNILETLATTASLFLLNLATSLKVAVRI